MPKSVPKMTVSDVEYAIRELESWGAGERGSKLTWWLMEKSTGFSRQTLSANEKIAGAYAEAKEALQTGKPKRKPRGEDYLVDRVDALKKELDRYKGLEAEWLERWARYAFNCKRKGFSVDDLEKPLPPNLRT